MGKRAGTLAVAILLLPFASCMRTWEVRTDLEPETVEDAVAIELGSFVDEVTTKAPVDAWNGQEIHVYGIPIKDGALQLSSPYIDNVVGVAPSSGGTSGKLTLNRPNTTEPFFYKGNEVYDFFGFYEDGAAAQSPELVADDGYYVDLTLDGTQDVMLGVSNRVEAADAADLPLRRVFSAYAARRGVQPQLHFSHLLSRFKFRIRSGSEEVAAKHMSVTYLGVETNTTARLKVAGETGVDGTLLNLDTKDFVSKSYDPGEPLLPMYFPGTQNPQVVELGSLLVAPGDANYKVRLGMTQDNMSEVGMVDFNIDFSRIILPDNWTGEPDPSAQAGHQYVVTMVVYSFQDVRVTVSLTEWEYGGEMSIDPDEGGLVFVTSPAPQASVAGDVDIPVSSEKDYEFTLEGNVIDHVTWFYQVNSGVSPSRRSTGPVQETLHFHMLENTSPADRSCTIRFFVEGKPDATIVVTQQGVPADVPDEYGVYPQTGAPQVLNPATQYTSVYEQGDQRWSRFITPGSLTVTELGPIPVNLTVGDEFDASFVTSVAGVQSSSQALHLRVAAVEGDRLKLLSLNDWTGYTVMY